MAESKIRMLAFAKPWLVAAGACCVAADQLPEYRQTLVGAAFVIGGSLMSYLAIALPRGGLRAANADRPTFL